MRVARICKTSQSESLSAYADGMLDGLSMRKVAKHVDSCSDCKEALAQMNGMKSLFRGVRDTPSAPDAVFWAGAFRTARLAATEGPSDRPGMFARPPKWRLVTLTAFGVAAIVLTLLPTGTHRGIVSEPVEAAQSIDVNALVASHASLISDQPLADRARISMIESDTTAQNAGPDIADAGDQVYGTYEAAPDGGPGAN